MATGLKIFDLMGDDKIVLVFIEAAYPDMHDGNIHIVNPPHRAGMAVILCRDIHPADRRAHRYAEPKDCHIAAARFLPMPALPNVRRQAKAKIYMPAHTAWPP